MDPYFNDAKDFEQKFSRSQSAPKTAKSTEHHQHKMNNVVWDNEFFNQFAGNQIPPAEIEFPPQQTFDSPEMIGSMQRILSTAIGTYAVIEFLIGTTQMTRKQGVLYQVGVSYVTLYDDMARNFITCDLYSIKFVYFYYPGDRPNRNYNALPSTQGR